MQLQAWRDVPQSRQCAHVRFGRVTTSEQLGGLSRRLLSEPTHFGAPDMTQLLQHRRQSLRTQTARAATSAAVAICLGLLTANAHANLLVNGSFELPLVPVGGYTNYAAGSASVVGWSIVGIDAAVTSGSFTQNGITFQAQAGNQWIDLAGVTSNSSLSGVSQSIVTTPGAAYEMTFYVGSATDGSVFFPSTIDLSVNGQARVSYANLAAPTTSLNWKQFNVGFIAQGASTSLTFYNGCASNNFNCALDNVSVTAVPEPTSGGLLLMGLSAVVAAARARRR
jgi:hypothetical protein